ncbi:MAG: hypothetical protein IT370_09400 [Deltaproteobacteria bacterium]|nr:hypothetical protein [Deltaproteobacteria bacterium]
MPEKAPINARRYVRDTVIAELLDIPLGTIRAMASRGTIPGVLKLGPRSTRYDIAVIAAWMAAKTSTAAK